MADIAGKLQLLINTKEDMRETLGLDVDVPFSEYPAAIPWFCSDYDIPDVSRYADFTKNRYAQNGTPASRADVYTHVRLSAATDFVAGKLVEFGENDPRISGKGLLLEPEITNLMTEDYFTSVAADVSLEEVEPFGSVKAYKVTGGVGISIFSNNYPAGSNHRGLTYRSIILKRTGVSRYASIFTIYGTGILVDLIAGEAVGEPSETSGVDIISEEWLRIWFLHDSLGASHAIYRASVGNELGNGVAVLSPSSVAVISSGMYAPTEDVSVSEIILESTPVTRAPDISRFPVAAGETVTFDGDEGISYVIEGGEAVFTTTKSAHLREVRIN